MAVDVLSVCRPTMLLPLKTGIASALDRTGLVAALQSLRARRGGLVLGFHRVLGKADLAQCYDREVAMADTVFEELLALLTRETSIVPLLELLDRPESSSPRQRVALTFDDGWDDSYSVALPMLERYNAPATVFLCTALMGEGTMLPEERFVRIWNWCAAHARLPELLSDLATWEAAPARDLTARTWGKSLKQMPLDTRLRLLAWLEAHYRIPADPTRRFLTWDEARAMQQRGISFGSHTARHATLTAESQFTLRDELTASRQAIQRELGDACSLLAWPNGACNAATVDAARHAGYAFAFTIEPGLYSGRSNPLAIPRVCLADSLLTGKAGSFHASRARVALQNFSGGPIGLLHDLQLLPRPQHI